MSTLSALDTAAAVRRGDLFAREAAEQAIARIEEADPRLNAVAGRRFEAALAEIDAGLPDGPRTGVLFLVKGLGTQGSRLFSSVVSTVDSELVRRRKRAGLVILGATNTPEFGLNASTEPQLHDLSRSPGGSSGGSAAAVAAGLVRARARDRRRRLDPDPAGGVRFGRPEAEPRPHHRRPRLRHPRRPGPRRPCGHHDNP
ncbi:amidase family protein [Amycolatopsis sp. M39]|uniref:amidase family protein n=2 Tax=Amycolatopsis TaxID=1813 RepID=UPI0007E2A550|nr:amidase family protein [Amycolatopsis sp. M39]OAP25327.1 6-aminohexanoate-cyclic-dimer hydrolase [Amycolatopsis sp. M39]